MVASDDDSETIAAAREKLASGGSLRDIAALMREAGMSLIEQVRVLRELTGMDLVDAKHVAYESSVEGQRTLEEHQGGLIEPLFAVLDASERNEEPDPFGSA
jgi:ribosomal protein L7/L12